MVVLTIIQALVAAEVGWVIVLALAGEGVQMNILEQEEGVGQQLTLALEEVVELLALEEEEAVQVKLQARVVQVTNMTSTIESSS